MKFKTLVVFAISGMAYGQEFIAPELGKFRNCEFESKCVETVKCDLPKKCERLRKNTSDCAKKWKLLKAPLGLKTKIPLVKCKSENNKEYQSCVRNYKLEYAKCKLRKTQEKEQCLEQAAQESTRCSKVKEAEIATSANLNKELVAAIDYLSQFPYEIVEINLNTGQQDTVIKIRTLESINFKSFFSFFYSKKKYPDWNIIPNIGYSGFRDFVVIGDYLVFSPEFKGGLNNEIQMYTAALIDLKNQVGIDGMSQLFSLSPEIVEAYAVAYASEGKK